MKKYLNNKNKKDLINKIIENKNESALLFCILSLRDTKDITIDVTDNFTIVEMLNYWNTELSYKTLNKFLGELGQSILLNKNDFDLIVFIGKNNFNEEQLSQFNFMSIKIGEMFNNEFLKFIFQNTKYNSLEILINDVISLNGDFLLKNIIENNITIYHVVDEFRRGIDE